MINELKCMYEAYIAKSLDVRKKAPLFAGILGLGSDPRKHPCHEEFYEAALTWTEKFVESQPSAEAAMEAASYILEAPEPERERDAFWFLWVAVGNIRSLIPFLTQEDCKVLMDRFDQLYKKRDRMPVQAETYKMLKKAAK